MINTFFTIVLIGATQIYHAPGAYESPIACMTAAEDYHLRYVNDGLKTYCIANEGGIYYDVSGWSDSRMSKEALADRAKFAKERRATLARQQSGLDDPRLELIVPKTRPIDYKGISNQSTTQPYDDNRAKPNLIDILMGVVAVGGQ